MTAHTPRLQKGLIIALAALAWFAVALPALVLNYFGQAARTKLDAARRQIAMMIGARAEVIERAEDREKFNAVVNKLKLTQPPSGIAADFPMARKIAEGLGYPVLVRPSFVLGGRAMAICYDVEMLEKYIKEATEVNPDHPVLVDKFIEDAIGERLHFGRFPPRGRRVHVSQRDQRLHCDMEGRCVGWISGFETDDEQGRDYEGAGRDLPFWAQRA